MDPPPSSTPLALPPRKPSLSVAPSFASSPFSSSIVTLLPPPLRRRVTAAAAATSSSRSRFSLLFALLLFLVLILSFHVRDVVQKANKENRLLEYGSQVSPGSTLIIMYKATILGTNEGWHKCWNSCPGVRVYHHHHHQASQTRRVLIFQGETNRVLFLLPTKPGLNAGNSVPVLVVTTTRPARQEGGRVLYWQKI